MHVEKCDQKPNPLTSSCFVLSGEVRFVNKEVDKLWTLLVTMFDSLEAKESSKI
jgi:hypothetical protein